MQVKDYQEALVEFLDEKIIIFKLPAVKALALSRGIPVAYAAGGRIVMEMIRDMVKWQMAQPTDNSDFSKVHEPPIIPGAKPAEDPLFPPAE